MAVTPRMTVSISDDDKAKLKKVMKRLNMRSTGQLLEMLVSGDEKVIDWIADGFKRVNNLF